MRLQLHFSGNSTVEGAMNWLEEHANDTDLDEMLLVEKTAEVRVVPDMPLATCAKACVTVPGR